MTELPRLLDSTNHPGVRALLEAGLTDNPTEGSAQRAVVGLGLSAGALVTITSGVASGATGAPVVATGVVASAAASSLIVSAGQWLALGLLGGLGLIGGVSVVGSAAAPVSARPVEYRSNASPVSSGARPIPARLAGESEVGRAAAGADSRAVFSSSSERGSVGVNGKETASAEANDTSRRVATRAGDPGLPSSALGGSEITSGRLGREVSLIDEARRELAAGEAPRAQATLDAYDALARTGTLDREAQILRIEALTASGQRAAAVMLARSYLQAYPSDPHAPMLRQLVTEAPSAAAEAR
jgi:hypothetical protein